MIKFFLNVFHGQQCSMNEKKKEKRERERERERERVREKKKKEERKRGREIYNLLCIKCKKLNSQLMPVEGNVVHSCVQLVNEAFYIFHNCHFIIISPVAISDVFPSW